MPTLNLGQVRPVYRGAWNSIDTYSAYDFVIYNGSAYLALKDVPANYEPPSQTEYWVLFGAKGESGAPGKDGADGAQGERGPSPGYRWNGTFLSIQNPDGTWPDQGVDLQGPSVPLSNSVTSTSETDAASSKAVKTAYDLADNLSKNVPSISAHAAMPDWTRTIELNISIDPLSEYAFTATSDGYIAIVVQASFKAILSYFIDETFLGQLTGSGNAAHPGIPRSCFLAISKGSILKLQNLNDFNVGVNNVSKFIFAQGAA